MILVSIVILFQNRHLLLLGSINNVVASELIMALAYLVSAIIYIITRNFQSIGGDIASAAVLGFFGIASFFRVNAMLSNLSIWIWLGLLIAITFLVWHIQINQTAQKDIAKKAEINRPIRSRYKMHRHRY